MSDDDTNYVFERSQIRMYSKDMVVITRSILAAVYYATKTSRFCSSSKSLELVAMDKIKQAVDTCLANAAWAERPFFHVRTFIDELKADKTWSAKEINEVQTIVVRAIMHMQKLEQSAH